MKHKKKLIEVALPLDAINKASAREKSIRHSHPNTLHLWWSRKPLATARAVIFAQMVDDPSFYIEELLSDPDKKKSAEQELKKRLASRGDGQTIKAQSSITESQLTLGEVAADLERKRLFTILEDLVIWENITNEVVLQKARDEIWRSWRRACSDNADHPCAEMLFNRHELPGFHDPFAGGGALPLEAQRLGLKVHAGDLNPVAVLINKAMIEIPPKFSGGSPVNPEWTGEMQEKKVLSSWGGSQGLAEDIRYYGKWMRVKAKKRIEHLYPKIEITDKMAEKRPDLVQYVGRKLPVIAWLWARTVKSPNPAFSDVHIPLASTFILCKKQGKDAYVEPVIESEKKYSFTVKVGIPSDVAKHGTSAGKRNAFRCLFSDVPVTYDYIRAEGKAGRMSARLMAIVAEGDRERIYLSPMLEQEMISAQSMPEWKPDTPLARGGLGIATPIYGLTTFGDLFTPRQLVALTTFSDLVAEAITRVKQDAIIAGFPSDGKSLRDEGKGAVAYAEAVGVYLAFAVDKCSDYWSNICTWHTSRENIRSTFGRQAIQMMWSYAEANPFSASSGNWNAMIDWIHKAVQRLPATKQGSVQLEDAQTQITSVNKIVSTDPPYYDNIGYADLSDFFYVWLRRSLGSAFPGLFTTLVAPKAEELVAAPYRHDSKEKAGEFFLEGMTKAMQRLAEQTHPTIPVTIYYAFKQTEKKGDMGIASTGWETFLNAVIRAGFSISGTWPMRTELSNRMRSRDSNALASSIVLVCRKNFSNPPMATRHEFLTALRNELPSALMYLQDSNIAPVDLAQAAIGPGMAIYTRYSKILNAQGEQVSVLEALILINRIIDEVLSEQEGDFDADTRWALEWFKQQGFAEGDYGVAETLSKAKNTSIDGLVEAGVLAASSGRVRLLRPNELSSDWDPATDKRLTIWEIVHHLMRVLDADGEDSASKIVAQVGSKAEVARELCYHLYAHCENNKHAVDGFSYNSLVQSWPEVTQLAQEKKTLEGVQTSLFDNE